jgi:hypothetical protein
MDAADFSGFFKGQFVIPCYAEINENLGDFHSRVEPSYDWYEGGGLEIGRHPLTVLTDVALSRGSLAPLVPIIENPGHLFSLPLRGEVESAVAVIWGAEDITQGELTNVSTYLRSVLGTDSRAYLLEGKDPLSPYVSNRKTIQVSEAQIKIWLYIGLSDSKLIRNQLSLVNRVATL